ncbi:hypothetical protein GW17_00054189 [Ensete ventricosum]|nr:hypothetical protein GW17_00054189 [Ensete ventricosum]
MARPPVVAAGWSLARAVAHGQGCCQQVRSPAGMADTYRGGTCGYGARKGGAHRGAPFEDDASLHGGSVEVTMGPRYHGERLRHMVMRRGSDGIDDNEINNHKA